MSGKFMVLDTETSGMFDLKLAATDPSNEAMQAQGMSLRDWFAGQALSGFMMAKTVYWDDAATMAYKAADAMLAARGAK